MKCLHGYMYIFAHGRVQRRKANILLRNKVKLYFFFILYVEREEIKGVTNYSCIESEVKKTLYL